MASLASFKLRSVRLSLPHPQTWTQSLLERITPAGKPQRKCHVSGADSGKMCVVVFKPLCFRADAVLLWRSEGRGNIRPDISRLSGDQMPEGVALLSECHMANFMLLWTHTKEMGCPLARQWSQRGRRLAYLKETRGDRGKPAQLTPETISASPDFSAETTKRDCHPPPSGLTHHREMQRSHPRRNMA